MIKTALVHDWLFSLSGAEKTLEAIYSLFPSPIYTLIKNSGFKSDLFLEDTIRTSFLQKLPFGQTHYPYYLPLFPLAIEKFNLSEYDLILSSSSSVAKNILSHSGQCHICYCHSPMRYIWDLYYEYLHLYKLTDGIKGFFSQLFFQKLRSWDFVSSQRVDFFIANSATVAKRIFKLYKRESKVIHPPVNVDFFLDTPQKKEDYFFTASRLVPYKKIDLIIESFSKMPEKKLFVAGQGPEMNNLKKIAPKNVFFLGHISDLELKNWMKKARAFLYMAYEDFGILPVEAQACATPVIAFSKGGCSETVIPDQTGLLYHAQSCDSLVEAIHLFEKKEENFDPKILQEHAKKFSKEIFLKNFQSTVLNYYNQFNS